MSSMYKNGKLLISFVGRHRGERLVTASKQAGARGGTIAMGKTISANRVLCAFSLADMPQDIVFTLLGSEAQTVIDAVKAAALAAPKKLSGMAILLDVTAILARFSPQHTMAQIDEPETGSPKMNSGHKLLTVIVNDGYAEDVMAAARKAGATGGTILTARGTGTEEDVKFFGISLVPEKDMLLIVVDNHVVDAVIAAISTLPQLSEPGGGIAYTVNVEKFIRF